MLLRMQIAGLTTVLVTGALCISGTQAAEWQTPPARLASPSIELDRVYGADADLIDLVQTAAQPPLSAQPSLAPQGTTPSATPSQAPTRPRVSRVRGRSVRQSAARTRLAGVPNMFGDSLPPAFRLYSMPDYGVSPPNIVFGEVPLILGGGAGALKVSDNNKALPVDRIYFNYKHFHNAFRSIVTYRDVGPRTDTMTDDLSLNQYTLGIEKTFFEGSSSIEVRMPFLGDANFDFAVDPSAPESVVGVDNGNVGNLAVIFKQLIHETDRSALAIGVGVETPTGSNAESQVASTIYHLCNDAFHIEPFVGYMQANQTFFLHSFLHADIPTNGNYLGFVDLLGPDGSLGTINPQTLLYYDLSLGAWLVRDPSAAVTGLATFAEVHYTTTLNDADAPSMSANADDLMIAGANRADVVNFSTGLHFEFNGQTTLRLAGVFPAAALPNRFFDAEFAVQINRRFGPGSRFGPGGRFGPVARR